MVFFENIAVSHLASSKMRLGNSRSYPLLSKGNRNLKLLHNSLKQDIKNLYIILSETVGSRLVRWVYGL